MMAVMTMAPTTAPATIPPAGVELRGGVGATEVDADALAEVLAEDLSMRTIVERIYRGRHRRAGRRIGDCSNRNEIPMYLSKVRALQNLRIFKTVLVDLASMRA